MSDASQNPTVPRRRGATVRVASGPAAAAVLLALAATLPHAVAAAPAGASSSWTLSQDGADRQCRLTLRPDTDGKGAPVAMPPGCRRAFPGLSGVVAWAEVGDALRLVDSRAEPRLVFEPDGAGFRTTTPQGDRLVLTPADGKGRAALDRAAGAVATTALAEPGAKGEAAKPAAARKPGASEKPAEVAGRYAVLRDKTHDTGCMVTLDDKAHGPGATFKARLAPACRDQGIVIFDPIGWQVVGGKLVLTARKGHTTELQTQDDGSWMNEPKKGKALSLKRI